MFMDSSTLHLDGSKGSIFITSTDEEDQRSKLNDSKGRNKLVHKSVALPMSVRNSPLREAIYLTNQSVRKFKFPSAYAKVDDVGTSKSVHNSVNLSKDRIDKLKEMINLPSLSKRRMAGDQSLDFDSLNNSLGD